MHFKKVTSLLCKYDYCGTLYKKQIVICDFTFPQLCSCDLLVFVVFMMEVNVGDSVEAVDQLGILGESQSCPQSGQCSSRKFSSMESRMGLGDMRPF